ncbi:MarR family winged helix-turn-helix transcriptional regulator [Rhodococcoides kyotonense]|uniref:DNA-binding transcriptional regulator, MarR family n=1 Tax=Rhodococcoides kyotonense TaxID=398843 RepID=A0A239MCM2_9NOCA|nr:MarR family transcriptional regulator [Rhodococcus kyotonensis]SNT39932.1 DNA-binding transcriptional regulator, MarR family [Rhodococcus kyotonensis]
MATTRSQQDSTELDQWRALTVLSGRITQEVNRVVARKHELTMHEVFVLSELTAGNPQGLRIQDLADSTGVDQSSMSRTVKRLESRGLTQKVSCDFDKRGVYCQLTDEGRALAVRAVRTCRVALSDALDGASFEPRTAAVVARLRFELP